MNNKFFEKFIKKTDDIIKELKAKDVCDALRILKNEKNNGVRTEGSGLGKLLD